MEHNCLIFFFFFFFQGLENGNEKTYMWLSRLGSRPPNCQHKCEGCIPCDPIQTPTTTDQIGVQYANYVPEGWKCKCGTSFFNPWKWMVLVQRLMYRKDSDSFLLLVENVMLRKRNFGGLKLLVGVWNICKF